VRVIVVEWLRLSVPLVEELTAGTATPMSAAPVHDAGGRGSRTGSGALAPIAKLRCHPARPFSVNLFVHATSRADPERDCAWLG
jgi:nitronate monooxygenase